jgi:uncharacterized Zn-binding protein involved in type VI secretion
MSVVMASLRGSVQTSIGQWKAAAEVNAQDMNRKLCDPVKGVTDAAKGGVVAMEQTAESSVKPLTDLLKDPLGKPPNPVRAVVNAVKAVQSIMQMPTALLETGVAALGNMVPWPSFPAAYLGSLYVGAPHAHLHPPSLVPPAPPVPLPSMGSIMLGTCVKVLIAGMPAARVGDLGIAPTCGGLAPFFSVKLGSSKVFIGGNRAARMTDMCNACTPDAASAINRMQVAMQAAGMLADLVDMAMEPDANKMAAQGLAVAMNAAQMAADAAASALSATMGTDPAVPPALPGFIMLGAPTVLVAGLPVPATVEIAKFLKNKLKGLAKAAGKAGGKLKSLLGGGKGCK